MWRNGARSTGEPEARRSITSAKQSITCGHTTLKACRKGLSSNNLFMFNHEWSPVFGLYESCCDTLLNRVCYFRQQEKISIETNEFHRGWKLGEEDLREIQAYLLQHPGASDLVLGNGAYGSFDEHGQVVGSRVEPGPYTSILPTGRPPG